MWNSNTCITYLIWIHLSQLVDNLEIIKTPSFVTLHLQFDNKLIEFNLKCIPRETILLTHYIYYFSAITYACGQGLF